MTKEKEREIERDREREIERDKKARTTGKREGLGGILGHFESV